MKLRCKKWDTESKGHSSHKVGDSAFDRSSLLRGIAAEVADPAQSSVTGLRSVLDTFRDRFRGLGIRKETCLCSLHAAVAVQDRNGKATGPLEVVLCPQ
jgi:hypothetical protein